MSKYKVSICFEMEVEAEHNGSGPGSVDREADKILWFPFSHD